MEPRTLVQALPMPAIVLDFEDVVLAANAAGIAAFVRGPASPVGKNFKDVVADTLGRHLGRAIADAKRDAAPQIVPAAGPYADLLGTLHVNVLQHDDGTIMGLLILGQRGIDSSDVSARLETTNAELQVANEELAARLEEVREAHRLDDERNHFLAMLAHELRNPLATITNAVHLLRRRRVCVGDRLAEQALRIAERQTRNQARLIDDLLDISRIVLGKISLRIEPTDLLAVVRQAIDTADFEIRSHAHRLRVELPEPDTAIRILADPVRLEQIVTNLLGNAVKYTPPGGDITVAVSTTTALAIITVTDSGVGIEANLLERIFDLFTQADTTRSRSAGGLGIGLTVVRQLVRLHGGTIEASSRGRGQGSTFEVRLPRSDVVDTVAAEPASRPRARARRILIVDDNRDARELLRTILELDGHHVQDAGDGASAVRLAVEWTPEIALIDIGLPEIDGYELARRIRKRLGEAVRLVAVTGYGDSDARRLAADAGFDEYLVKPVDPAGLSEVLKVS